VGTQGCKTDMRVASDGTVLCSSDPTVTLSVDDAKSAITSEWSDCVDALVARGLALPEQPQCDDTEEGCSLAPGSPSAFLVVVLLWVALGWARNLPKSG
jgi:hypothetical protein